MNALDVQTGEGADINCSTYNEETSAQRRDL